MYLSIYLCIYVCIYLSIYLSTYLPIYLPTYLPIYVPTYLSTYISITLVLFTWRIVVETFMCEVLTAMKFKINFFWNITLGISVFRCERCGAMCCLLFPAADGDKRLLRILGTVLAIYMSSHPKIPPSSFHKYFYVSKD